jgi:uncharacterized protein YqeY
MYKLEEQIEQEANSALKNKEQLVVSTLRLLKAAIKNERIALGKSFTEADLIKVLRRELKKRLEAAEIFKTGQREDLAAKELMEAEIIRKFLPQEITDEQLTQIIQAVILEGNFSNVSDFGQAMKVVMAKVMGQADGSRVSKLVKEQLSLLENSK